VVWSLAQECASALAIDHIHVLADPVDRIAFLHIPKSAGTSISIGLEKQDAVRIV
jgi:hypothetical protein